MPKESQESEAIGVVQMHFILKLLETSSRECLGNYGLPFPINEELLPSGVLIHV